MILSRRKFFTGLAAGLGILAAPAIIKTPGLLMPVKARLVSRAGWVPYEGIVWGEPAAGIFVQDPLSGKVYDFNPAEPGSLREVEAPHQVMAEVVVPVEGWHESRRLPMQEAQRLIASGAAHPASYSNY